jgi:hypothetical protein
MAVPKLNNHIEQRASKEIEIIRTLEQHKEEEKESKEKIQKEELCSRNKNIVKSSN